jgi:hypothetical protein
MSAKEETVDYEAVGYVDKDDKDDEFVEVRLKPSDLEKICADYAVDVITPKKTRLPFEIPRSVPHSFGYTQEFQEILREGDIKAVDHGEFQECADKLINVCKETDKGLYRPPAISLQRCRRGGKTFMSYAVASLLEDHYRDDDTAPFVIFISMNSTSRLFDTETAMNAVLARIAFELVRGVRSSNAMPFFKFRKQYVNFEAVSEWIEKNNVILIIDELNVVEPTRDEYETMSQFLDNLIGRRGCALLYTTHHKLQADLIREGQPQQLPFLSLRAHLWQPIPRFNSVVCVRHMGRSGSLWSAVLRGRIPALFVLPLDQIKDFMSLVSINGDTTRRDIFDAVLTGDISKLETGREVLRAYAYLLKRDGLSIHAWPPFLIAQHFVLGKNCPNMRAVLEAPDTNQAKAFEALSQLAVVLRLLSSSSNACNYVPRHPQIKKSDAFSATAIFEVGGEVTDIAQLRKAVIKEFSNNRNKDVRQVVVIPLFESFPVYDFFLFFRARFKTKDWKIAVGYQCKMGTKYPDSKHQAVGEVGKSVWIEGRSPITRLDPSNKRHGWILLSREDHLHLLGESMFSALPLVENEGHGCDKCDANNEDE